MDDVREVTVNLLKDRPEVESALEELLEVDEDGPWTYDDLSIDSGTFGELVSRGIAEKNCDGYRVSDPEAIRAALDGGACDPTESAVDRFDLSSLTVPDFDRQTVVIIGGALAFVALVRVVFMWSSVFRGSDIVLAGNDPYYYRYWIDTLLESGLRAFDVGSLMRLPEGVANGDVLLIVSLWWTASLIGSSQTASGLVVAWFPVVAAVVSAALLYLLAIVLTNDRRVGLAAVLTLSVTPAHAFRSALGYGDHHAFDFVWLTLVVLTIAVLTTDQTKRGWPNWVKPLGAIGLGVGVAAQTTAWRGGPILLLPITAYIVLKVVNDVRAGRSPVRTNQWVLSGLLLGGLLTLFAYSVLGWMEAYRGIAPALLALGGIGVVGVGAGWVRVGWSARALATVEALLVVAGSTVLWFAVPSFRPALQTFQSFLTSQNNIAETQSLISGGLGSMLVLGLFLFLALPYLAVRTWRVYKQHQSEWLISSVFSWYLLGLAIFKLRFAGELSIFVALFAGVGFVHIAERIELARPTIDSDEGLRGFHVPNARSIALLGMLFVLFASFGVVQTPVKMSQIAIDDETYSATKAIENVTEEQNLEYPENYVYSSWGDSRVFNYFASGESQSYNFARRNYRDFITDKHINSKRESQVISSLGFVVTREMSTEPAPSSRYAVLHQRMGSKGARTPGASYYRAIYISPDRSLKVFQVVSGAHIIANFESGKDIRISTDVVVSGETFRYQRAVKANDTGHLNITVPYSGVYNIGNQSVNISEEAVQQGEDIRLE